MIVRRGFGIVPGLVVESGFVIVGLSGLFWGLLLVSLLGVL